MSAKIIYNNNSISDGLLAIQIDELIKYFKECSILEGDIVAFKANSYYGTIIHWLACCKAGIIPLLVPFYYKDDLIKEIIIGIEIKGMITTKSNGTHYFIKSEMHEKYDKYSKDTIKYGSVLHITSATTGIPKIVIRTKEQLDSEIKRYISQMAYDDKDVFFPIVPLCHSFGFVCSLLTSVNVILKLYHIPVKK
jgi:Acyl-CoA synthetases (AMP-forming)/AMP-acid ligases II